MDNEFWEKKIDDLSKEERKTLEEFIKEELEANTPRGLKQTGLI